MERPRAKRNKRLLEQELEHERALLRTLIDTLPDGVFLKDTASRFILANRTVAQRTGVQDPRELIGKTDRDFFPKEQADEYLADERRIFETGISIVEKAQPKMVAGSLRWFLVTKVPVLDERGAITGLVGVSRDVTDQRLHEQALTRLTRLYREISLTNQLIVRETDRQHLLEGICRIAVEDGGLLMAWVGFVDPETQLIVPAAWYGKEAGYLSAIRISTGTDPAGGGPTGASVREDRPVFTTDIATDLRMGPWREAALQRGYRASASFPLRTGGKAVGAFCVYAGEPGYFNEDELLLMDELAMDVSYALENLERERVRIRTTTELEENEAKRRLLERQLVQAQKFESLGTLASGIAHDFNNILAIVMGHSSLLAERVSGREDIFPSVSAIKKAAERGAALVRQLLTIARKTESVFGSIQLNEVILDIVRLMRETFPKSITISTELREDLPRVIADITQLHQVFINLCINARDAMPRGGELTIRTSVVGRQELSGRFPTAAAREYAAVCIKDTGIGMDESTLQRAFDPFFTTKGPGKGTGLGLALAYSIIENHQGTIGLSSEPGKGTSVLIHLPIEERVPEAHAPAPGKSAAVLGGTETVLVIEDEEMLLDLATTILVERGYRVLTARDGEEGVTAFAQNKDTIAVVIADLGLPKLGGDEVFARIREIDPRAKIILASGLLTSETVSDLRQLGVKHVFNKPYSPEEMLRLIRTVIDAEE